MWRYLAKHLPRKALYHIAYHSLVIASQVLQKPAEQVTVFDLLRVFSDGSMPKH